MISSCLLYTSVTDAEEGIYFIEEVGEETADGNVLKNVKYFDSEEKDVYKRQPSFQLPVNYIKKNMKMQ